MKVKYAEKYIVNPKLPRKVDTCLLLYSTPTGVLVSQILNPGDGSMHLSFLPFEERERPYLSRTRSTTLNTCRFLQV